MLAEVPGWKIDRWEEYERLEPFATERLETQIARLFTLYYNDTREKQHHRELKDNLLSVPVETPKELSPEQVIEAQIEAARAAEAADKARRGG